MSDPVPQGRYRPAKRWGNLVFTSGMTPRRDGVLIAVGKIRTGQLLDVYRDAVLLAVANALTAARNQARDGESLVEILSMTVFIAAEADFADHSRLADLASDYLSNELGPTGIGARAAVGVASLPGDACVEIQIIAVLGDSDEEAFARSPAARPL